MTSMALQATARPKETESARTPERLDALTALRAIAATAVVLLHFDITAFPGLNLSRYIPFVDHYYLGVDLFFILSGFILAHVHGQDFAWPTPRNMGRFYILRLARIYPAHAAVLMMYLGLFLLEHQFGARVGLGLRADADHYTASAFIAHLLLMSPGVTTWNSPAWSVSAEWFAYLWFPLLAFALRKASPRWCVLGLVFVTIGFAGIYFYYFDGTINHLGLLRVSFEFPAGYLLYRATFHAPLRRLLPCLAAVMGPTLLLFWTSFAEFGCVLLIGGAVALAGSRSMAHGRWRIPPPIIWLGEISYSVYLIHALVMGTVGRVVDMMLPRLPLTVQFALVPALLAVIIACGAILHRTVEKPARDWMRAWLFHGARVARDRVRALGFYESPR